MRENTDLHLAFHLRSPLKLTTGTAGVPPAMRENTISPCLSPSLSTQVNYWDRGRPARNEGEHDLTLPFTFALPLKLTTGTAGVPPAMSAEREQLCPFIRGLTRRYRNWLSPIQLMQEICSRCALIAGGTPAVPVVGLSGERRTRAVRCLSWG